MLEALIAELETIEDPRCEWKVEHRLLDILVIAVCAVLGEAESFEDIALYGRCKQEWLARFLALPNGIPSHDTFRRVLMLVDPEAFERSFLGWVRAVFRPEEDAPRQIAIDGKTVRRSFDRRTRPLASAPGQRLRHRGRDRPRPARDRGARAVSWRSCPSCWTASTSRGCLVSLDALACQPGIAERIVGRGGDYLLALKGNRQEGARRGEGLVRGQRLRARRAAAPLLRRVRRRPRPPGAPAGVRLPELGAFATLKDWPGLADGGGGRDHSRHPRPGQGHGRDPALPLERAAPAGDGWRPPSGTIGGSRTGSTGSSTSASARTLAGCGSGTRPETWRCCARSR